jgi:hypothetical protein
LPEAQRRSVGFLRSWGWTLADVDFFRPES